SQKYNDIDPSFLDGLSLKYFGSSEPMHAIYLKKFLVGAVARARNPGCKLDTVLMLVGAQGCGKSAFLENLFGRRFFTDQIGGELNDKDEKAKVSRYWCLEYAEFEAVYKKRDVSSLKRFITAKEDTFRAPYARKEARHPRPSLFAGTTNETEILLDPTGDRRFWVLKVEIDKIPQAELIRDRDKIWAAADSLYKKGERWDLTDQEERSRIDLNKEFRKTHFWEDIIEQLWLDSQPTKYITTEMIARGLGFESASSVKGYDLHTMKEVLERLGFTKVTKRINGVQSRSCWERKTFKVGLEEKPPVTDVTPVTSLATSGFETVTPSYDKEVAPVTGEVVKIETVMPVTPSCNKGVIPSNPVAPRVVTGVTGVTAAISENQKSEIENYIAPAINAELLRECIADQNWQMVIALTEDWSAEYKSEVWACLSESEKQSL
ncbi:MAG: virulence-associated E family protein, partial [Dolichospermum sp.]